MDETMEANDTDSDDMALLPAVPVIDDAYYFGANHVFQKISLNIGISADGTGIIVWEYYDGGSWSALADIVDGTTNFRAAPGWHGVEYTQPADWCMTDVGEVSAFWIRARATDVTGITVQPKGTQVKLVDALDEPITRRPLAGGNDATFGNGGSGYIEMTVGTPIFHDTVGLYYVDGLLGPMHTGGVDRLKSETYQFGEDDIGTYIMVKALTGIYKIDAVIDFGPFAGCAVLKNLEGGSPSFSDGTNVMWAYVKLGDGRLLPLEGFPDGRFIRLHDGGSPSTTYGYFEILVAGGSHVQIDKPVGDLPFVNPHWELWNYEGEEEESSCWDWPLQLKVTP